MLLLTLLVLLEISDDLSPSLEGFCDALDGKTVVTVGLSAREYPNRYGACFSGRAAISGQCHGRPGAFRSGEFSQVKGRSRCNNMAASSAQKSMISVVYYIRLPDIQAWP